MKKYLTPTELQSALALRDVTRDSRHSRHVSPTVMLRSHTSAGMPAVLDSLRGELGHYDRLHVLPGLVYRRDAIDRTHVGAPHQMDLWRIKARGLLRPEQVNVLLRLVLQPLDRALTDGEANRLRDRVYRALHRGEVLGLSAG